MKKLNTSRNKSGGLAPKITAVAHDALAIVVNPANTDTVFTQAQVKRDFDRKNHQLEPN